VLRCSLLPGQEIKGLWLSSVGIEKIVAALIGPRKDDVKLNADRPMAAAVCDGQYSSSLPHHVSAVDADAGLEREDHGVEGSDCVSPSPSASRF
jgi:hypothetical protein